VSHGEWTTVEQHWLLSSLSRQIASPSLSGGSTTSTASMVARFGPRPSRVGLTASPSVTLAIPVTGPPPSSTGPEQRPQRSSPRCSLWATGHLTRRSYLRRARRGIEFTASSPEYKLETSSTLRELFGIYRVLCAIAPHLSGGRHKVVMDNLGCVFIMGGVVPPFATGARQWGEFVSGGSPNPCLQQLAVLILDLQYTRVPADIRVGSPGSQRACRFPLTRTRVLPAQLSAV
jgi:hypothetical protein